jgi:hypothetical protein
MSEKPPDILDYRTAGSGNPPPPPRKGRGLAVFLGILAGALISGIIWPLAFWSDSGNVIVAALIVLVVGKLLGSILLITLSNRWRFHGIGLLISIALGGMIFFFSCAIGISIALKH